MTEYVVYKVTCPDGYYYYGYTAKSLKERIRQHRLNLSNCGSHTSMDTLTYHILVKGYKFDDCKVEELVTVYSLNEARLQKYGLCRHNPDGCLNIRGKQTNIYEKYRE